jgi:TetR/AcrR family transcriptional repressor of nem operon
MPKPSHRETILIKGMQVMHERGFNGATVRDIVRAAGVPQGSFTNHFASKEAFALEALDLYYLRACKRVRETIRNETLSPLQRIRSYFEALKEFFGRCGPQYGCLYGNFAIEASDQSEAIRKRMVEIFDELKEHLTSCLKAAAKAGELTHSIKHEELANFIIAGLQGAILVGKSRRNLVPLEQFERVLFSLIEGKQRK